MRRSRIQLFIIWIKAGKLWDMYCAMQKLWWIFFLLFNWVRQLNSTVHIQYALVWPSGLQVLEAQAVGVISLRLNKYTNSGGKLANGHCCDGKYFACFTDCDHYFIVCMDRYQGYVPCPKWENGQSQTGGCRLQVKQPITMSVRPQTNHARRQQRLDVFRKSHRTHAEPTHLHIQPVHCKT